MESAADPWSDRARATFARYDDTLLRAVAGKLVRPRSQWPADELIDRALDILPNAPVIDRRLKELPPACRNLLAVIGKSRHSEWPVGQLLALLAVLGHTEGLAPVLTLLDAGLACPDLPEALPILRRWEDWLGTAPTSARLFIHPAIAARAATEDTGLPVLSGKKFEPRAIRAADGLEWLLRIGVLWQQLRAAPVRMTQAQTLFKRDLARLQADPLLAAPPAEPAAAVPDAGVLAMALGHAAGLFVLRAGELCAADFPPPWDAGLGAVVAELWAALPDVVNWDPVLGYTPTDGGAPFPTIALPAMLLLAVQEPGAWTHPADIAAYIAPRHPAWTSTLAEKSDAAESWIEAFALGWALPLRLMEAAQDGEGWWFRLSDLGRHLLAGGPAPDLANSFPQCLVVQPNGDVIAYRQGLTAPLVSRLSRFADWKTIGPACTLGLTAEGVYRGLEAGLTPGDILGTLQQHGAHALPPNVADLVRRWAGKRERIAVYAAATLLEFNTPGELEAAYSRGLVAQKLTDRLGLAGGAEVDYRHFRLLGNRDYEAKPQRCVAFDADGVTFAVDVAASDLLLEAELGRLAEPAAGSPGERRFRITPRSARALREHGMTPTDLEQWCVSRSGEPLAASARLLSNGGGGPPGEVRRQTVLRLASEATTNGVCQWPDTAKYVGERLGPNAIAVEEENVGPLVKQLAAIGVEVIFSEGTDSP